MENRGAIMAAKNAKVYAPDHFPSTGHATEMTALAIRWVELPRLCPLAARSSHQCLPAR